MNKSIFVQGNKLEIKSNGNHKLYINGCHVFTDSSLLCVRNYRAKLEARLYDRKPFKRVLICDFCIDGEITFHNFQEFDQAKQEISLTCSKCEKPDIYCDKCGLHAVENEGEDCEICTARQAKEKADKATACWGCYHDYKQIYHPYADANLIKDVELADGSTDNFCPDCLHEAAKTGQTSRAVAGDFDLTAEWDNANNQ